MWAPIVPLVIGFSLLSSAEAFSIPLSPQQILGDLTADTKSDVCPLPQKVLLDDDGFFPSIRYLQDEAILHRQVDRLSKAVQLPTVITDSMTDPNDDAFRPFVDLGYALALFFPHMYALFPCSFLIPPLPPCCIALSSVNFDKATTKQKSKPLTASTFS